VYFTCEKYTSHCKMEGEGGEGDHPRECVTLLQGCLALAVTCRIQNSLSLSLQLGGGGGRGGDGG